jgi:hypothetical protein
MALALVYAETERTDEAQRLFDKVWADDLASVPNDLGWLPTVALAALVCSHLGEADKAGRLFQLLEPYQHQCVFFGPSWLGSTAHYLGLMAAVVGDCEEANHHFAHGVDAHTRVGSPVWRAHTQLRWGEMLLEGKGPGPAEVGGALVDEARHTAERLGMGGVVRRAQTARKPLRMGVPGQAVAG